MKVHQDWRESVQEKLHFVHLHGRPEASHGAHEPGASDNNPFDGHHSGSHRPVRFFFAAPWAQSVDLVGDFNHWHPFPMTRSADGWWAAQVELTHGHHRYRFLVDGKPTLDPNATGVVRDDHDERFSLMAVS